MSKYRVQERSGGERNSRVSDKLSKRKHDILWQSHGIMGKLARLESNGCVWAIKLDILYEIKL